MKNKQRKIKKTIFGISDTITKIVLKGLFFGFAKIDNDEKLIKDEKGQTKYKIDDTVDITLDEKEGDIKHIKEVVYKKKSNSYVLLGILANIASFFELGLQELKKEIKEKADKKERKRNKKNENINDDEI